METDELKHLKQSCEDSLELLEDIAFIKVKRYKTDRTGMPLYDEPPYYLTVAENPDYRVIYEVCNNIIKYRL